jgi:subtilase family serine protease
MLARVSSSTQRYSGMENDNPESYASSALPMHVFALRVALSLQVCAAALSAAALLTYVRQENAAGAYTSALAMIITLVAAYHYHAILAVRTRERARAASSSGRRDDELEVDGLR